MNIPWSRWTFLQLPSTFCASRGTSINFPFSNRFSVNFRELSAHPQDPPSTLSASLGPSVSFLCVHSTFHQLFVHPQDLLSTSVTFLCIRGIFCQLPSTFCASVEPSVNSRQLSAHPWDHPSTFQANAGPSVNFCQLSVR